MMYTPEKKSRIPVKIILFFTIFIIFGCVVAAGCVVPINRNTTSENPGSPTVTPSLETTTPAVMQTPAPSITVTSPNGGETWQRGTSQTVTWSYTGSPGSYVKIMLVKGSTEVGTIASSVPVGSGGTGSYSWPIYSSGITGGDYKVSVQSISQPTIKDASNNYFTLTPAGTTTSAPDDTVISPETSEGQLTVSVGDYKAEPPATVFVDNERRGVVSRGSPLDLITAVGVHTVRICVIGTCLDEDVMVLSTIPAVLDFGDRLNREAVTAPLRVSIGGYDAVLPVFVDNSNVGNVSMFEPLDMRVSEGSHDVKVCVGILCVNETAEIRFGHPVYIDFGERLKKVAEFPTPTIRITDTRKIGAVVTVDVEFINPTKRDLPMSATVELAYSYIDPKTHWRSGSTKKASVAATVKAGTRAVKSVDLWLTGGSSYLIEIPVILDSSSG